MISRTRLLTALLVLPAATSVFADGGGAGVGDTLLSRLYEESLMQSVAPIAPAAASLGRYGNHPVDLATGLVPISINLYEVKCGSLSVPIRLTYHGGGIKVEQDATWVGLGWDLDFGGSVIRTMNGHVDEEEHYDRVPDADSIALLLANNDYTSYSTFYNLSCRTAIPSFSFKPDLFSYSVLGRSGTFFTDDSGRIHTVSHEAISGSFNGGAHPVSPLFLMMPDGTQCRFNSSEQTRIMDDRWCLDEYPSTYYIRTIVSADGGDTIRYEYQESGQYEKQTASYFEGLYTSPGVQGIQSCPTTVNPMPVIRTYTTHSLITNTVKPHYMHFRGGRVRFVLSDSLYKTHDLGCKKLERIEIQMRSDSGYCTVRSFRFVYARDNHDRLFLKSVWECGQSGARQLTARFDYYEGLPARNSNSIDYWGFFNGKVNQDKLPRTWLLAYAFVGAANRTPDEDYTRCGSLKRITYQTGGSTEFLWELNRVSAATPVYYDVVKSALHRHVHPSITHSQTPEPPPVGDEPAPDYGISSVTIRSGIDQVAVLSYKMRRIVTTDLNHNKYDRMTLSCDDRTLSLGNSDSIQGEICIQFLAGQSYTVIMEANCSNLEGWFTLSYDESVTNEGDKPFAGLRIREMVQRDKDSTVLNRRLFDYLSPDGKSSGYLTTGARLSFIRTQITETDPGVPYLWHPNLYERRNTLVCTEMVTGPRENEYGYEYVTETTFDGRTGRAVSCARSRFSRILDEQASPLAPTVSKSHLRGRLLEREELEAAGDSLVLFRSTRNTYSGICGICEKEGFAMHTDYSGLESTDKVDRMPEQTTLTQIFTPPYNYTYTSDWLHPDSTIVSEYGRDGRILRRETIRHYGNILHAQPIRIEQVQGRDTLEEHLQYAPDLQDPVSLLMTERNVMALPIARRLYRRHEGVPVLQGGLRNAYDSSMLLSDVFRIFPDGHQKRLYNYTYSGLLGNHTLRELVAADSTVTSVLWNAEGTRPLHIARGMGWQALHNAAAQGTLLRTNFPGTEIRSYTYHPDGTVSSITDAGGNTVFYEYDPFGRLRSVKNRENKETEHIEYNLSTEWP